MATRVDQSDISLGAVILDDEEFARALEMKTSSEIPQLLFKDVYFQKEFPSCAESSTISLDAINAFRKAINQLETHKHLNIPPMTIEEYNAPSVFEYVKVPVFRP